MKNLILLLCILLSQTVFSQEVSAKFAGDWTGKCLLEKNDDNSIKACGICHYAFSKDSNSIKIRDFNLNFTNGEMTFKFAEGNQVVPFNYTEKTERMVFELEGNQYDFKVIYVDVLSKVILKSAEGDLVYLERKSKMRN